jgi:hypothetical protein
MPRSNAARGQNRSAMSDSGPSAPEPGPRSRLARDLFLLGLKQSLSRGASGGSSEPLATLLARSLAGMAPTARPVAEGLSHGR